MIGLASAARSGTVSRLALHSVLQSPSWCLSGGGQGNESGNLAAPVRVFVAVAVPS